MPNAGSEALDGLARELEPYGAPIIVFNKSHSGSRLLGRLLRESGVFMGDLRNDSEDACDLLRFVRPLVERYYPRYDLFFKEDDAALMALMREVFSTHLQGAARGGRWGWKLCETLYVLPILARLFPGGRFIHLVRDGRDVAFCDHVAPDDPFWKKIYFNTSSISKWRGLPLNEPTYRQFSHLFNAQHWVNSVGTARSYGTILGERYLEIRYEELVTQFMPTARSLANFLSLSWPENFLQDFSQTVRATSVGKYRRMSPKKLSEALTVLEPTLSAFGYGDGKRVMKKRFWPF